MQKEQIISFVSEHVTDTGGALHMLSERSEKDYGVKRSYSADTLRYHVLQGNLPAYVFSDAQLVRWTRGESRRGQSYFFLKSDIIAMPLDSKAGRKPKTDKKESEHAAI